MIYKNYVKRLIDIILSSIFLILLFPVYIIIGLVVKITEKSTIFYNQTRTGQYGKKFKIHKFRTMKNKKMTKIGRLLRFTSLDELPQFFNVLKGEMSIIGPRPWIPEYYDNFNEAQKRRVDVKPGIIGLAQVNGRKNISVFEKINYDIEYVNNISFILDLKILIKSFNAIVEKDNIKDIDKYIENEINMLQKQ